MINCPFVPSAPFSRHGNDGYKINFDINKQRAHQHEINYGMQTIGGHNAKEENYREGKKEMEEKDKERKQKERTWYAN